MSDILLQTADINCTRISDFRQKILQLNNIMQLNSEITRTLKERMYYLYSIISNLILNYNVMPMTHNENPSHNLQLKCFCLSRYCIVHRKS